MHSAVGSTPSSSLSRQLPYVRARPLWGRVSRKPAAKKGPFEPARTDEVSHDFGSKKDVTTDHGFGPPKLGAGPPNRALQLGVSR